MTFIENYNEIINMIDALETLTWKPGIIVKIQNADYLNYINTNRSIKLIKMDKYNFSMKLINYNKL